MRCQTVLLALPTAVLLGLAAAGPAAAAAATYQIDLGAVNASGAGGSALLEFAANGDLTVTIEATDLVPNAPHAQHIHGGLNQDFTCPDAANDRDGDGIVSTVEGQPDYGDVFLSLTTRGDASAKSGLAVDRMPTADAEGNLSYQRTIPAAQLPRGLQGAIKNMHVVQHGIDANGNGTYDADAGPSELNPAFPQEATAPASCGAISGSRVTAIPAGGVETGTGPAPGPDRLPLLVPAGLALAGAAGLLARRRFVSRRSAAGR